MTEPKPSAWLYERRDRRHVHKMRLRDTGTHYYGEGWTETPLYTREAIEAAIVAWLRDGKGPYVEGYGEEIADAIECGEYRSKSDG